MKLLLSSSVFIFSMLGIQTNVHGLDNYVKCNNNDLVLYSETNTGLARGESTKITYFKISNKEVVNHFKSIVPNLKIHSSNSQQNIYSSDGLMSFVTDGTTYNKYYKNKKETSSNSYIVYLDQEETEKSFILLSSRYNKGIKIEIYENLYPLPQIPVANWYFQDCNRVNTWSSSFDPLDFWSITNNSTSNNTLTMNSQGPTFKKKLLSTQNIWEKHINSWKNQDIKAIMADYASDAQVIVNGKVFKGKENISNLFTKLFNIFGRAEEHIIKPVVISEQVAYIIWSAKINGLNHPLGTDTFIISNSKIKYQTITSDEFIFKDL